MGCNIFNALVNLNLSKFPALVFAKLKTLNPIRAA